MHIHLLRVSSESETMRKFVMCIAGPLKSNRTNSTHTILHFLHILEFIVVFQSFNNFNNFCHSLMQVSIENILKTKGMLYNAVSV